MNDTAFGNDVLYHSLEKCYSVQAVHGHLSFLVGLQNTLCQGKCYYPFSSFPLLHFFFFYLVEVERTQPMFFKNKSAEGCTVNNMVCNVEHQSFSCFIIY